MDSWFAQSASCRTRARWRRLPGTPPPAATVYPATKDRRSTERHLCANAIVKETRQENPNAHSEALRQSVVSSDPSRHRFWSGRRWE